MTFWSGQTLREKLRGIVVEGYQENKIDCAAYTLTMGRQYFITPTKTRFNPLSDVITDLKTGQYFNIPSGQFAFLLTEEKLKIPSNVLAFISIKFTHKRQGLINVSGFHVDPGYEGRLIFAVYNAGPKSVHLKQGDEVFLIWFCNVDDQSDRPFIKSYDEKNKPVVSIPSSWIDAVSGHVYSPMTLIHETRANREWIHRFLWLGGIVATAVALVVFFLEADLKALRQLPVFESKVNAIEAVQLQQAQTLKAIEVLQVRQTEMMNQQAETIKQLSAPRRSPSSR